MRKNKKKSPLYSVVARPKGATGIESMLYHVKEKLGRLPPSLAFLQQSIFLIEDDNDLISLHKRAASIMQHYTSAQMKDFVFLIGYLDLIATKKREYIKRLRRTRCTDAVREKRRKVFKVLKPFLNKVDSNWSKDKAGKDSLGEKTCVIESVWDEDHDEIRVALDNAGLKRVAMSRSIFAKRFEEYLKAHAFMKIPLPSGRVPLRYYKSKTIDDIASMPHKEVLRLKYLCLAVFNSEDGDDRFDIFPASNTPAFRVDEDPQSPDYYAWLKDF